MNKISVLFALLAFVTASPKTTRLSAEDEALLKIFGTPESYKQTKNITNEIKPSTIVPPINNKAGETSENCLTNDGVDGTCVSYYQCNSNNSIITDGVGLIDIRASADGCKSYMDVCCSLPDTRDTADPIKPATEKVPQNAGCGWRNPNGVGFHTTGDKDGEAKFGEFPWMTAILKIEPVDDNNPNGQKLMVFLGGGSLIHPRIVLTAAHYVAVSKTFRVRVGEWDTQTTKEIYPHQDRDVSNVVVHERFNNKNLFNDVALLFLSTPVELAPNVGVVCLPPPREVVAGGTQCFASGWGKDKFDKSGTYQVILKKVELPVVEHRQCESKLRSTRVGRYFRLHSTFMCAGGVNGTDTCKGDGGSPLVCPIENEANRYVQRGIVAWGIGCGDSDVPGVYVDVATLRDWIDGKVMEYGFDTNDYSY